MFANWVIYPPWEASPAISGEICWDENIHLFTHWNFTSFSPSSGRRDRSIMNIFMEFKEISIETRVFLVGWDLCLEREISPQILHGKGTVIKYTPKPLPVGHWRESCLGCPLETQNCTEILKKINLAHYFYAKKGTKSLNFISIVQAWIIKWNNNFKSGISGLTEANPTPSLFPSPHWVSTCYQNVFALLVSAT